MASTHSDHGSPVRAHRRTYSDDSTSSTASANRLVLEHLLNYPGTYELPLRTMYALNSAPAGKDLPKLPAPAAPTRPTNEARQLTSSLLAEMSQRHQQPSSLPPAFITAFVRKCFAADLPQVDFAQALTALDYLKDLELRRHREAKAALERLQIDMDNYDTAEFTLREVYPKAADWYKDLQVKMRKVDAFYTQVYVSLRRWVLVNELSLTPFNKRNCIAMLNTVYPPVPTLVQPTPQLTPDVLKGQRGALFQYIQSVEKKGTGVLAPLMTLGQRSHEDRTGWPSVRDGLDKYLQMAVSMVDECSHIISLDEAAKANPAKTGRKVDSGISFLDSRKSSISSDKSERSGQSRPETPNTAAARTQYKSATKLEKIARELRHMRRTKTDVSEIIHQVDAEDLDPPDASGKPVRKMKSIGTMNLRRTTSKTPSNPPDTAKELPTLDADTMAKYRAHYGKPAYANFMMV